MFQEAPPARVRVLDNGLTVVVREVHTAPLAAVWCFYRVGSKDEPPGRTGLSHWVEHMNFKGTSRIPREEIKGIVERLGGSWNGYTWIDQTAYVETAGSDALGRLLFIEAERMHACLYDPQDCESERTVIISELQGSENDPDTLLDTEVTASAFKVHPYRHPTIGWLPDLQAMTRDDLYGHYRRFYVPGNATLVVAGDVETDAALRLVEAHFGGIPAGAPSPRARVEEPEQVAEHRVTIRREGTAAYLKLAFRAPAFDDPGFFPLLVLDAVLAGAKGLNLWTLFRTAPPQRRTRLYQALVERGLASSVSGAVVPTAEPFLYTMSLVAGEGATLSALEAATLEALDDVRAHGVTEAELATARHQLRARLVFDEESVGQIAHQLGFFLTLGREGVAAGEAAETTDRESLASRLDAVTAEAVAAVAARTLAPSNRTVGWFEPIAAADA